MERKIKNTSTNIKISAPGKTYGPNRFEIPTQDKVLRAINLEGLDEKTKSIFTKGMQLHKEIDPPNKSDWLWDHKEGGQTFKNYISGMINSPSKSFNTIYIQNLDEGLKNTEQESFLNEDMLEHLRILLELYYPGIKAKINTEIINFETLKITSRYNDPYFQFEAPETLQKLSKKIPKDGLLIIGLTSFDIYPGEDWNFVFGLANKEIGCGVFSFRRYYDEIATNNINNNGLLDMVKLAGKVMLHEVGHLFALKHCIYYSCLMNGSNHMQENLKKPFEICPVCLRKIWGNLKFDIIKRFEVLADGLTKINEELYREEIDWYFMRIK